MQSFAKRLIAWHVTEGRHNLPWQKNVSAYRVWVSEIMLQQTQVQTVIPYYRRFIARFPSLTALAKASVEEVLAQWAGLGYYARARNLHRTARTIRAEYGGRFPKDKVTLMRLPGIGRSTAAAILALVHGQRHAILDGNVQRIIMRHANIAGRPQDAVVKRKLWHQAEQYLPSDNIAAYTQALMDLGATTCTKGQPQCSHCPVATDCGAKRAGCIAERPSPRPSQSRSQRQIVLLMAIHGNQLLLERRPPSGIWGGLLSFPEMPSVEQALAWCQRYGGAIERSQCWSPRQHQLTHIAMQLIPLEVWLSRISSRIGEENRFIWQRLSAPMHALPAPIKILLEQLQQQISLSANRKSVCGQCE